MISSGKCDVCGKTAECVHRTFGTADTANNPVALTDYAGDVQLSAYKRTGTFAICDDCAKAAAVPASKAWITLLVAAVLYPALIYLSRYAMAGAGDVLPILSIVLIFAAMIVQLSAAMTLLMSAGFGKGKTMGLSLLQMVPLAGFLVFAYKRSIDRGIRAVRALKPVAKKRFLADEKENTTLRQMAESGQLTDEEKLREYQRSEARRIAQQEAAHESARKGKVWGALLGIAVTVIIMLQGCNVYSNHTGYMTLFRTIELTPETFALVIGALVVFDVVALVRAFKR